VRVARRAKAAVDGRGPLLVRGDDDVLVRDAVLRLIDERVGDADRALVLADFAGEDYALGELVDAAQTPPLFTDRRVVVGWGVHRFKAAELAPLVAYLADPLDSTDLILVSQEGRIPKALTDAVSAAGGTVLQAGPPSGRGGKREFIEQHAVRRGVRLDSAALAQLEAQLGEDVGRVVPLMATLAGVYGEDTRIGTDELRPFLGEAGAIPPWELTDAIDKGDVAEAVRRVRRMLIGGERHPLQLMVTLTNHVERMLALSGSGARSEREAAALLGVKGSTFPARKALEQSRRLGPARIGRAIDLLADADLDLRGNSAWEPQLVMEVLVARLASLGR
jgi:DNA polymerase-3 subunit delta